MILDNLNSLCVDEIVWILIFHLSSLGFDDLASKSYEIRPIRDCLLKRHSIRLIKDWDWKRHSASDIQLALKYLCSFSFSFPWLLYEAACSQFHAHIVSRFQTDRSRIYWDYVIYPPILMTTPEFDMKHPYQICGKS